MHGERYPQPYERGEESYMAYVVASAAVRAIAGDIPERNTAPGEVARD